MELNLAKERKDYYLFPEFIITSWTNEQLTEKSILLSEKLIQWSSVIAENKQECRKFVPSKGNIRSFPNIASPPVATQQHLLP